jgi:NADPH:quinone reductase-like Zn-dependent oxidoreductase
LSGFSPVIATCSPHNFDLVKSRGADEVFDYHDLGACAENIRSSVGSSLKYAYVCAFGEDGPKVV